MVVLYFSNSNSNSNSNFNSNLLLDIYNNCIFNDSIDGIAGEVTVIGVLLPLNVTVLLKLDIISSIVSFVNKSDRVNSCELQADLPFFIIIGPFLNKLLIVSVNVLVISSYVIVVSLFLFL